jgi:toxin ParE1/3/4
MRIIWSRKAISNLIEIREYIAQDKPEAARLLAERILRSVERLAKHPHLGHAGREPETRELVVTDTPYVVPYRIHRGRLAILAVLHGARDRTEG